MLLAFLIAVAVALILYGLSHRRRPWHSSGYDSRPGDAGMPPYTHTLDAHRYGSTTGHADHFGITPTHDPSNVYASGSSYDTGAYDSSAAGGGAWDTSGGYDSSSGGDFGGGGDFSGGGSGGDFGGVDSGGGGGGSSE